MRLLHTPIHFSIAVLAGFACSPDETGSGTAAQTGTGPALTTSDGTAAPSGSGPTASASQTPTDSTPTVPPTSTTTMREPVGSATADGPTSTRPSPTPSGSTGAPSGGTGSGGAGGVSGMGGRAPVVPDPSPRGDGGAGGTDPTGEGGNNPIGPDGSGDVAPSPGCGQASGRPQDETVPKDHIYTFPDGYDGSTPFPLLIGLHGCGNQQDEWLQLTNGSPLEAEFVRAFPNSANTQSQCWSYNADIDGIIATYDELMETYCIDMNRVFATGHSSGAQMVVQILTHEDDAKYLNFKGVAPVAASDYGAIAVEVPVMYIQGKMDTERGEDGASTVARFRSANGCDMNATTYDVMGCQSGGTSVDPGCVEYDGCNVPTVWCSHNDPFYNGTSHGVPCFAADAMHQFFTSL